MSDRAPPSTEYRWVMSKGIPKRLPVLWNPRFAGGGFVYDRVTGLTTAVDFAGRSADHARMIQKREAGDA